MAATGRSAAIAVILSLVVPGLGHLYLGRWLPGVAFLLGTMVVLRLLLARVPAEDIAAGRLPADLTPVIAYTLVLLGLLLWCVWDAHRTATRRRSSPGDAAAGRATGSGPGA